MAALDPNHNEYLDSLMVETVSQLVDGNASDAADGLQIIAKYFARAGLPIQAFWNIRKHLIDSAIQKVGCPIFVKETLTEAERLLNVRRSAKSQHIIH